MEGERDLPDRHGHSADGEAAGLQVGVHARVPRDARSSVFVPLLSSHAVAWLRVFLLQGLHEAGGSGRQEDWLYCQFTGRLLLLLPLKLSLS